MLMNALKGIVAVSIFGLAAATAQATTATLSFDDLVGVGPPEGSTLDGNTLSGVAVGDLIEVVITVDNTAGDAVQSLFTFLEVDPDVLAIRADLSVAVPILQESGFGANGPLSVIGTPEPAFGQPDGTHIGLAHGTTGDPTAATLVEPASVAVFEVIGSGSTDVAHVLTGNSIINQDLGGEPLQISGGSLTVVVPEPGSFLASLAALGMVTGVVGVRRRWLGAA